MRGAGAGSAENPSRRCRPQSDGKTICLAVSPSLKAYGIPGRARLFEVVEKVKQVNARRLMGAPNRQI